MPRALAAIDQSASTRSAAPLLATVTALLGIAAATLHALPAAAQSTGTAPEVGQRLAPDRCLALARGPEPTPQIAPYRRLADHASVRLANLEPYQARLTFLGHATFLIETPKGVRLATDYARPIAAPNTPDVVTMNVAHSSHYTDTPQAEIQHVLRGWNPQGGPAIHDLQLDDLRVRNVPTNIRSWDSDTTREFGNSIFVFEIGPLCIAHLGHLHHPLSTQQLANIGQMDVVLTPVDGSYTLDLPGMLEVLTAMNPRYIVPMHYFSRFTLERFLAAAGEKWPVRTMEVPTMVISKDQLPAKTEIVVLPGW